MNTMISRATFAVSLVLFILLFSGQAFAAVGVTEVCQANNSNNVSTYACGAFGPNNDAIVVVFACVSGTADDGAMTGGGLTWTQIGTGVVYNTSNKMYAFWADTGNPAPGLVNPTMDVTGDDGTGVNIIGYEIAGAETSGSNPVKQFKTGAATSTNPTIVMDANFTATSASLATVCGNYSANFVSAIGGGSWNEQMDHSHTNPTDGGASGYLVGESGNNIQFTNGSSIAHGWMGVEICESGLCGGGGGGDIVDPFGMSGFFGQ